MFYCKLEAGLVVDRALFDDEMPEDWPDAQVWVAHEAAQIGWTVRDGQLTPPDVKVPGPSTENGWVLLRLERDRLLGLTDWVVVRAFETGIPMPNEWITYRQALRDLPETAIDPAQVEWPQQPA